MGIYSGNRYSSEVYDYASEIPANEAYDAAFGCAHILADCQANDMALFESAIYDDIKEVMSIQEGTMVINENAFTNIIKKIIEMFKKLIAKIKGIFNAFIAKLEGLYKSGKDLIKKYEKQILKCANWKSFKLSKIRRPKNNGTSIIDKIGACFNLHISNNYEIPSTDETDWAKTKKILNKTAEEINDMDTEDLKLHILKEAKYVDVNISDLKDFSEEVTNHIWDDEDTLNGEDDNINSSFFTTAWIKGVLNDDKWISNVQKANKNIEDKIDKIIDDLKKIDDKIAKEVSDKNLSEKDRVRIHGGVTGDATNASGFSLADSTKKIGKDDKATSGYTDFSLSGKSQKKAHQTTGLSASSPDTDNAGNIPKSGSRAGSTYTDIQKYVHALQKVASNEQEVITKVTSEYLSQVKFATSQARKLWSSAASYSSTTHKESAEYYDALGESIAESVYSYMEAL